jgi:hypothetical protein
MNKIEFKIGKKEYEVKDVNLMNYKDILEMLENPDKDTPYEIVEMLSGCPKEELMALKTVDWYFLWREVEDMLLGSSTSTTTIVPVIEFQGVRYSLPSIEDMSIGEFADLDVITSGTSPEKRMAEIAAILYRPIVEETPEYIKIESYSLEGTRKRQKLFQYLPLTAIKSANTFFLQCLNQSLKNMLDSLTSEKNNSTFLEDLADLEKSHPQDLGGLSLTSFLEKIPSDLNKLQNYLSGQASIGLLGNEMK